MSNRTLLLDADMLVYEAALAHEIEIQWDSDLWTLHAHFDPAREQLQDTIKHLLERLEADKAVLALSDYGPAWRKEVMPTYKLSRHTKRKPIIYKALREFIHENYTTYQRPGLEGDDVLGILLTNSSVIPGEKILVSNDKDMNTLPGLHCKLSDALKATGGFASIRRVTEPEADLYHMLQALMGDVTDGYPGCPKIGAVTAAKVLAPFLTEDPQKFDGLGAWKAIVACYVKAGLNEVAALENARVARILRNSDYDFVNKEVLLWNAPLAPAF